MNIGPQPTANEFVAATSPPSQPPDALFLRVVKGWIWLSALAGLAGWSLSALGQLNRTGYAFFFAIVVSVIFFIYSWDLNRGSRCKEALLSSARNSMSLLISSAARFRAKTLRRFRRPLPGAFALLATLVLIGSVIYPPTNYTGLNYHLGRVLQWLAHGRWWWIHTPVVRMNYSGCAFEWLTTPMVLFTKSDRGLFFVNFLPFLLLPGLIFSVFTRLGVQTRVAWHWMWLLPTGYNFLLQAGSIGNDAFGAVYAMAAMDFACRAWNSGRIGDLWHSLLAVGLMTGTKPVSLPLLLPWLILVIPLAPILWRNWLPTLPVLALAGVASFFPIGLMNKLYSGDWLGRTVELFHKEIHQPLIGILGNAIQVVSNNFLPPIFPLAGWWNSHAASLLPRALVEAFNTNFEPGLFLTGEVPTEDLSGLGFGVGWLLVLSLLASMRVRGTAGRAPVNDPIPQWLRRCVLVAAWFSLLAYFMKSGMNTGARLMTPYYLLVVPLLLIGPGQSQLTRRSWWRALAGGVPVLALVVLILSPDRPLWPADTVLSKVLSQHPGQPSVTRALQVYTLYSQRNDVLAGVRELLPPHLKVVGFIGDGDDCDISLWRPFGSRCVEHFLPTDSPEFMRSRTEYVVVGGWELGVEKLSIDDWLRQNGAELVATTNVMVKISEGPQFWYVTRFKP